MKFKQFFKLIGKLVCIVDDVPFVLRGGLAGDMEELGSYLLGGAGAIVFAFELREGIHQLRSAYKSEAASRKPLLAAAIGKVVFSTLGLLVSAAIVVTTVLALSTVSTILGVFVPGSMAVITGIELFQKQTKLAQLEIDKSNTQPNTQAYADLNKKIYDKKRGAMFARTYAAIASVVASLALVSTLSTLGVLTLGIIPSIALIAVVSVGASIKIFEMIDEKLGFPACNAITELFTGKLPVMVAQRMSSSAQLLLGLENQDNADETSSLDGNDGDAPTPQPTIDLPPIKGHTPVTFAPVTPPLSIQVAQLEEQLNPQITLSLKSNRS